MRSKNGDAQRSGDKIAAAGLSVFSNVVLTVAKLGVGVSTGSVSVLSEAAHSGTDLLASWIALFSVRVSDLPADEEHPYGHGKAESLSGMAEALLIFLAAGYIIYESTERLLKPHTPPRLDLGIAVMAISAVANTFVARYLFTVAHEADSLALRADAEHLRTDVFTSAGVLVGLVLARATGWYVLDPISALAVALLIVRAAWKLSRDAMDPLMDTQLPTEDVDVVRAILDRTPEVMGYHKLRTRKSGSARYVDAHIQVDDEMSLITAHELTERLEDAIREQLPNTEITLHTEPYRAERQHQHEHHGGPPPDA